MLLRPNRAEQKTTANFPNKATSAVQETLHGALPVGISRTTVGAGFILPEASRSGKTDRLMEYPVEPILLPQDGQGLAPTLLP